MDLLAIVPTLSDAALTALVATASPAALRLLERHFGGPDCDCTIELDARRVCQSNECAPGACECPLLGVVIPCAHVIDHGQFVLPPHAHALLLRRLHPAEFAEPPTPPPVIDCLEKGATVGYLAERARRGLGLDNPIDGWRRGGLRLSEELGREVSKRKNGTAIAGRLYLPADQWRLTDEEQAELLDLETLRLEAEMLRERRRGAA